MDQRCPRSYTRHPATCQILIHGRAAGILMAIPFVLCFTLFGVFNLVGGTVLTIMACKPKISKRGLELLQKLLRNADIKLDHRFDPMQVVGIILLLTGCLLVIIGLTLGVVACRSVNEDKRRRKGIEEASLSGMPMSTMTERSSRRTSSLTFSPHIPSRKNGRKKSFPSENIASPILEVDSGDEEQRWDDCKSNDATNQQSLTELKKISCGHNSALKSREITFKVTWASDVVHSESNSPELDADVTSLGESCSKDSPKMLLTTDL